MNSKMTTNSELSTTEPKKQKKTKQTTRTGTESDTKIDTTWRVKSRKGPRENGGKGTGNKKHN